MEEIPVLSTDLITELDKMYPNHTLKLTDINKTDRMLWYVAGHRAVVDMLLTKLNQGDS